MKKLLVLFSFLVLAFSGYCAENYVAVRSEASGQAETIYLCVVVTQGGAKVLVSYRDCYYIPAYLDSTIEFIYSSQSHPWGQICKILRGNCRSEAIEGPKYTYGANIVSLVSDSRYVIGQEMHW